MQAEMQKQRRYKAGTAELLTARRTKDEMGKGGGIVAAEKIEKSSDQTEIQTEKATSTADGQLGSTLNSWTGRKIRDTISPRPPASKHPPETEERDGKGRAAKRCKLSPKAARGPGRTGYAAVVRVRSKPSLAEAKASTEQGREALENALLTLA
ncbi:hypothetical protein BBK36DRAFT_1137177 [Trichoderma citrinoviride]|uniref:Uncharacterized protein n=1 Tax=Trichoderma citrinoviride TaxID=58853 RepID=A0A2T4BMH0_9HYPO|nr:hypothetical protein BBK36DRAFT_1137177 [Trichoderma citrinoviride]PTB70508.1 hypothetical protein BBK36DRAFT_1137177 [Trichoderma citrinoviride]